MAVILSAFPTLAKQIATPPAGYTLVNGTGNIISWTTPNDGQVHRFIVFASLSVTSGQTGGAIQIAYTLPDGTATAHTFFAGGNGVGDVIQGNWMIYLVRANTAVTISQSGAMSAGAAVLWAEIWGG